MQALLFEQSFTRLAPTRALAQRVPRAFVGPTAPMQLRDIPGPAPPAPDPA